MAQQFKAYKKPPPDARIIKLRDYEEKNKVLLNHVQDNLRVHQRATWENHTDAVIKKNMIVKKYEQLMDQAKSKLDARRRRLAEKLAAEQQQLQLELKDHQETGADRREKMIARARALYEEREAERLEIANEKMYEAWREGCDPLRYQLMKKVVRDVTAERQTQLDEKAARKATEMAEKKYYDEMYEAERMKKEQRHLVDKQRRKVLEENQVNVLNEQTAANRERRAAEKEALAVEVAALKAKWKRDDDEAQAQAEARLAAAKKMGEELLKLNLEMQARRAAEQAKEAAEDFAIVQEAMLQAKQEEDRLQEQAIRAAEDSKVFREHLMLMMQKESADNSERDRLIQEAEDLYNKKRQDEDDRYQAARQRLLQEVLVTRDAQVQEKAKLGAISAQEHAYERAKLKAEMERVAKIEEEYTHMVRMQRVQNQMDIVAQIRQKENLKAKEKLEKERNHASQRQAEAMYQQMIANHQEEPVRWFGRKGLNWYD